jgi:protein TonB
MLSLVTRAAFAAFSVAALSAVSPASSEAAAACAEPQSAATVINAVAPDYPMLANELGDSGTAVVQVDLMPDGKLQNATIRQSSGSNLLDHAAIGAAKAAEFKAERWNCAGIQGSYLYIVSFER